MKNEMTRNEMLHYMETHHSSNITLVIFIMFIILIIIMIYFIVKIKTTNDLLNLDYEILKRDDLLNLNDDLFICKEIIKDNISNNEFQEIIKQLHLTHYKTISNIIYYKDFYEFLSKCPYGQVYTKRNVKIFLNTLNTSEELNILYLVDFAINYLEIDKMMNDFKEIDGGNN